MVQNKTVSADRLRGLSDKSSPKREEARGHTERKAPDHEPERDWNRIPAADEARRSLGGTQDPTFEGQVHSGDPDYDATERRESAPDEVARYQERRNEIRRQGEPARSDRDFSTTPGTSQRPEKTRPAPAKKGQSHAPVSGDGLTDQH